MNCLIVDDNKIARTTIKQIATHVNDIFIAGESASAIEAYNFLKEHPVEVVLLDIEMPGMTGLELTRNLGKDGPLIIFTTAKKEYAVEAFELNVVDYLVKPITPARFIQAIEKAKEVLQSKTEEVKMGTDEFIFIRDSNIIRRLKIDDILYAEAMGDYVKLHTPQKFYAIHSTLKAVESRLLPNNFLKVHRSYVVALNKIDIIQEGTLLINGKSIPVADAYRHILNSRMKVI